MTLEYDGTAYAGWQIQRSRKPKSIQGVIEKTLSSILQEQIRLTAAGRTDAGVHAVGQVANFKTDSGIPAEKLQRALNGLLPDDIVITKIKEAGLDFHSRFAAKSKIYRYTILNQPYPSALLRNAVYFCPYPLDIKLMRQEAYCLLGRHDFQAFCAAGSGVKSKIRQIKNISVSKKRYRLYAICYMLIIIEIEADGFLRNMARNIVGTLLEIGRGNPIDMKQLLSLRDRTKAGPTAPAKGLCLMEVNYR